MFCPSDRTQLQTADRRGVRVRWCPTCRGVWLERAEIEKLFEVAPAAPATRSAEPYASVDLRSMAPASRSTGLYDRYRNGHLGSQAQTTRERRLAELLDF